MDQLTFVFRRSPCRIGVETLLALGSLTTLTLLLLAHILVVPPYEGFDETAHYSYISHLADRGAIPLIGVARFDKTLARDLALLPRPYSSVPPYEQIRGLTYYQFQEELPDSTRRRAIHDYWSVRRTPAQFEQDPSSQMNGAPGHPPLYYALMTLPYRISASWSPGASHLFMRLLSIALVLVSYLFYWRTVRLFEDPELRTRLLGGGLLALHSPSLIFEFGRIGNDSLIVLLFSATFFYLVRLTKQGLGSTRDYALLGLVLGLGLITKLYFVATLVAVLLHILSSSFSRDERRAMWSRSCLLPVVAITVGGWWYVLFRMRYGVFFGNHLTLNYPSPDSVHISLIDSVRIFLRMFASATSTFLWSGSWSFLRPTHLEYALCAPFFLLATVAFVWTCRRQTGEQRLALTASMTLLLPLVCGTMWYMIDAIRHGVAASVVAVTTGSWHGLAVIYSSNFRPPRTRRFLPATLALLVSFEILGWWKQLLMYAGLLVKSGTEKSGVGLVLPTADVLSEVVSRLSGLGWPAWALVALLAALLTRTFLLWTYLNDHSSLDSHSVEMPTPSATHESI